MTADSLASRLTGRPVRLELTRRELYTSVGYTLAGVIPRYAQSANGALDPSAVYYRVLTEGGKP